MALSQSIIDEIRTEIGRDDDFSDNIPHDPTPVTADNPEAAAQLDSLENIFTNVDRGNFSILVTALICWKLRLASMVYSSFDVTSGGSLLARSQRIRFIERQILKLELLVDRTPSGSNDEIVTTYQQLGELTGAEFS